MSLEYCGITWISIVIQRSVIRRLPLVQPRFSLSISLLLSISFLLSISLLLSISTSISVSLSISVSIPRPVPVSSLSISRPVPIFLFLFVTILAQGCSIGGDFFLTKALNDFGGSTAMLTWTPLLLKFGSSGITGNRSVFGFSVAKA